MRLLKRGSRSLQQIRSLFDNESVQGVVRPVILILPSKHGMQVTTSWLGRTIPRRSAGVARGLIVLSLLVSLLTPLFPVQKAEAAANITGTVFADFNGNGTRDNATGATAGTAADVGVGGVTVRAYDTNSNNCATTTTAANGTYTLPMGPCTGTAFRVEFSTLPTGYYPSQVGGTNATTTQFVSEGGTANLGINQPCDYCQNNPTVVTNRMYQGGDTDSLPLAVLSGSPYNTTVDNPQTLTVATLAQTGTTWGIAHRRTNRMVYSSAYMKSGTPFGPGGTGAIYRSGAIPAKIGRAHV